MASKYTFETRDQRIERMHRDNPSRPIELCTAVVDGIWDKKRELIKSKIPERFQSASISDLGYLATPVLDGLKAIFDPPTGSSSDKVGMIFCGPAGRGKTYASYALINMIAESNPEMVASMMNYSEAVSAIKSEFVSGSHEEMGSVWDKLTNSSGLYDGVLFIDDVSSKNPTDFELDKFLTILEKRFNHYMPFLITTNVKQDDFKSVFGERIASRLLGYCEIVEFTEDDIRAQIKQN